MSLMARISSFLLRQPQQRARPASVVELPITTGGEGELHIPVPDPTAEDRIRDRWQKRGQALVRQEDWVSLSKEVEDADRARSLTPGGMSVAELLSYGARADVVGAVEHALSLGLPDKDAPVLAGIEALETVLAEDASNPVVAIVVAQAHIDIAWAWRGEGLAAQVPDLNMAAFSAHMDRAADILSPHGAAKSHSPLLMAAHCAVVPTSRGDHLRNVDRMAQNYEALIDLTPLDIRQMRNLGLAMLPSRYGDYARLTLEAHRTAARLNPIWGNGGYTWTMFDAIAQDPEALAGLDVDYFIDGLRDILAIRADQFTVNLLAAYCAVTMSADVGNDAADFNRTRIHACRDWIIYDNLTELHPLIWAHAMQSFDNGVRVRSLDRFAARGLEEGRRVLKSLFLPELARGQDIVFTEDGPVAKLS